MKTFTIKSLKKLLAVLVLVTFASLAFGQMPEAITIDPPNATAYDSITLTFNPAKACNTGGSLAGVPIVYMHSGVTIGGSDWQYVIEYNGTGKNGQSTHLLPNPDGTYSIHYRPFAFYGFPDGSTVTRLCAVFNEGQWNAKDGRDFVQGTSDCKDFFIPLYFVSTTPKFQFFVNMAKMVQTGSFDPLNDAVYVHLQTPKDTAVEMTPGSPPNIYRYTAMIESGLDSGVTYHYKFRINTNTYETVDRTITAVPGTTTQDVWWNDDPINATKFQVDMSQMVALGVFNPVLDYMDMAGSMNGWQGSPKMNAEGNNVYSVSYTLDKDSIYEFKFRINGNWATSEFPNGGPNRKIWGPDHPLTKTYMYNDYDSTAVIVTFKCNMAYQIYAGHFNIKADYLDVAGNFNGWGGGDSYDVLFKGNNDSIYVINKNVPRTYIGGSPAEFKFRFNGDWNTSEFPGGGPNRKYVVHDTVGGNPNIFECWYDDKDPAIPTAPWAYNLSVEGELWVGQSQTATYTYEDVNGDPEGQSIYKWYRADDEQGTNAVVIAGANQLTYVLTAAEAGKFMAFEVTPVAATGDSLVGKPVFIRSNTKVAGVGIGENSANLVKFYPNPVSNMLYFENLANIQQIEIYSIVGQKVMSLESGNASKMSVNTNNLKSGVYFMKFFAGDGSYTTAKFIKQ